MSSQPAPGCVFDQIVAGTVPAQMVLEEDDLVAFLDRRPVFGGHTLVVPRRHYPNLASLPGELLGPLFDAARRVGAAQRAALGATGAWVSVNDEVSQSVPHVHLHVVPRRPKDGLRGFFWPRTRYDSDLEAEEVAAALRAALAAPMGPAPGQPSTIRTC